MSLFDRYYRWELYCNWSLGHVNIQLQAFQTFLMLYISTRNALLSAAAVIGAAALLAFAGWWGVEKKGFLRRQNTISNKHNIEMMRASRRKR